MSKAIFYVIFLCNNLWKIPFLNKGVTNVCTKRQIIYLFSFLQSNSYLRINNVPVFLRLFYLESLFASPCLKKYAKYINTRNSKTMTKNGLKKCITIEFG